jgi:dephospho-CoA kinase
MTLIIGLTGGIASGKSTVSNMIKDLSIPVIDADEEARLAVEKGEKAYTEIIDHFGSEIIKEDGSIDRAKLGAIIFPNEERRSVLNRIVHPAVREKMLQKKERYKEEGHSYIVMDIPLLFESQLTAMVDKVIVVYVNDDIQLQRLILRNGLTEVEARSRISSQMPLIEKQKLADAVINNNGSIKDTRKQLEIILRSWGYTPA